MPTLEKIQDLSSDDRELLEAAGWVDPKSLARSQAGSVIAELEKANGILRLVDTLPDEESVSAWIVAARELTGEAPEEIEEEAPPESVELKAEVEEQVPTGPVNYEEDPDVKEMLLQAPIAIPVPNRLLAEQGIAPAEISVAPVLNRAESDLEVRVAGRQPVLVKNEPRGKHGGVVKVADSGRSNDGSKRGLDRGRVRTMEQPAAEPEHPNMEKRRQTRDERLTLLRTTKESTNRGRKPGTRRYIRGVLHDRPYKTWFGCLIVILFQIAVPLAIVSAFLLIVTEHSPTKLSWVPSWIIAFPISLPILGLLYFMVSFGVKCRVCGQKVLVHRHCRKNKKAHHVFGLGYVFPLAVQTLFFRWFNCTFCGTSIRIKE